MPLGNIFQFIHILSKPGSTEASFSIHPHPPLPLEIYLVVSPPNSVTVWTDKCPSVILRLFLRRYFSNLVHPLSLLVCNFSAHSSRGPEIHGSSFAGIASLHLWVFGHITYPKFCNNPFSWYQLNDAYILWALNCGVCIHHVSFTSPIHKLSFDSC